MWNTEKEASYSVGEQIFRCEALETWDRRVKTHKEQFEKEYDGSQIGIEKAVGGIFTERRGTAWRI